MIESRVIFKNFNFEVFFLLAMGDGKVEVVGLENSLYVGQIIAGVRQHGIRLAQCSTVELR